MDEKNRALQAHPTPEEARRELAARMCSVHISRIREMPRIELYLDQLLTIVTQELEFMAVPGEATVTGSMVNNYVKQGVIPAPRRKRYTRRHIASLLFVCSLKRVFSIAQVAELARRIYTSGLDLEALYDATTGELERSLAARFSAGATDGPLAPSGPIELVDPEGRPAATGLARLLEATVDALAAKVYVEQTLLLSAEGR